MVKIDDYKPVLVNLEDVPAIENRGARVWKQRFANLPSDKAIKLVYNNRQRAHQAVAVIRGSAQYWHCKIHTRVIHAEPAIHGEGGWLVYYWKRSEEDK